MREEIKAALNLMNKYAIKGDHLAVKAILDRAKETATAEEKDQLSLAYRATLDVFMKNLGGEQVAPIKSINIYLKPRNAKASIIHSIEILSGEFGDAADACREYCKANGLTGSSVKIFWNWMDSAWKPASVCAECHGDGIVLETQDTGCDGASFTAEVACECQVGIAPIVMGAVDMTPCF